MFVAGVAAFYVAPFFVFGWGSAPLRRVNDEFVVNGGMSYMTVARLVHEPLLLAGHWWLLGLAWVPALAVATALLRRRVSNLDELIRASAALVLVFFLTRTWLAEPNAVLIVLLALLLTSLGRLDRRALTALWVIPLLFTLFNASPLQLLWVAAPGAMASSLRFVAQFGHATLVARAALVVAWQVVGWWVVVTCLRRAAVGAPQAAPTAASRRPAPRRGPDAVELITPLFGDLSLCISDRRPGGDGHGPGGDGPAGAHGSAGHARAGGYPVARLQRGLLLRHNADDLIEEGVGFGVPVLKRGAQTIFPGGMELRLNAEAPWSATATFEMNLVERLTGGSGGPAGGSLLRAQGRARRPAPPLPAVARLAHGLVQRRAAQVWLANDLRTDRDVCAGAGGVPGRRSGAGAHRRRPRRAAGRRHRGGRDERARGAPLRPLPRLGRRLLAGRRDRHLGQGDGRRGVAAQRRREGVVLARAGARRAPVPGLGAGGLAPRLERLWLLAGRCRRDRFGYNLRIAEAP